MKQLGPGAMLFKIDISRAFRHIRINPKDINVPGIQHNDAYIDASLAFGSCYGSTFFLRCSDAIRHIMHQHGFPHLWNYIDDLIYTGLPSEIYPAYDFLLNLLFQSGLDISQGKLVPPCYHSYLFRYINRYYNSYNFDTSRKIVWHHTPMSFLDF